MTQPTSHLDKARLTNLADEIWKSAERLRGKFKAHEYQIVVLPIITIRRLECVLIEWREQKAEEIQSKRKTISRQRTREARQGSRTESQAVSRLFELHHLDAAQDLRGGSHPAREELPRLPQRLLGERAGHPRAASTTAPSSARW